MLKNILELFGKKEFEPSPRQEVALESENSSIDDIEQFSLYSKNNQNFDSSESARMAEFQIWQGVKLEKQNKLNEAIECYRRAVEMQPESAEVHQIIAVALKKQEHLAEAAFHYDRAAKLNKIKQQENNDRATKFSATENKNRNVLIGEDSTAIFWNEKNSDITSNFTEKNTGERIKNTPVRAWQSEATSMDLSNNEGQILAARQSSAIVFPGNNNRSPEKHIDRTNEEVAQIYLKQALAYCEQREWEQAIAACKVSLNICPDFAEAYKVWGNALQQMNQTAEAIGCYAKAISIQPNMSEAYANLGALYARQQKWHEAVEYFQKSLAINPKCAGVYRSLAKIWEELGNEDKALDCLFRALELEPQTLTAQQHYQFANELSAEGKLQQAIACYHYAISLDSNYRDAYLKLAKALEQNGQWQEANVYYQEVIRIQEQSTKGNLRSSKNKRITKLLDSSRTAVLLSEAKNTDDKKLLNGNGGVQRKQALLVPQGSTPREIRDNLVQKRQASNSKIELAIQQYLQKAQVEDSPIIQVNLGSLYANKQDWQQAIIHYENALELNPNSARAYRNLAKVYDKIGQETKAAELLYQAYTIEPKNISGMEHFQLGETFRKQNKSQRAIACYRRAIQSQPNLTNAYLRLGEILESQNNQKGAVACYRQAAKHNPDNAQIYIFLARILTKEENWERVISCYRQVIKLKPGDAEVYHNLGDALTKQSQWQEAIAAYQKAIALKPDFSWSHNNLGDALLQVQEWQAAASSFRKAIELNPDFPWSYYKLGNILSELEDWDEAVKAYSRARQLKSDLPDITVKLADAMSNSVGYDSDKALACYRDAIALEPDNLQLYYKAIELRPDLPELYLQLANALDKQNQKHEAVNFYKIALQLQPDNFEALQKLERVQATVS